MQAIQASTLQFFSGCDQGIQDGESAGQTMKPDQVKLHADSWHAMHVVVRIGAFQLQFSSMIKQSFYLVWKEVLLGVSLSATTFLHQ